MTGLLILQFHTEVVILKPVTIYQHQLSQMGLCVYRPNGVNNNSSILQVPKDYYSIPMVHGNINLKTHLTLTLSVIQPTLPQMELYA